MKIGICILNGRITGERWVGVELNGNAPLMLR